MRVLVGAAAVFGFVVSLVVGSRTPVRYEPGGSWWSNLLRQAPYLALSVMLLGGAVVSYLGYLVIESANS